MICGKLLRNMIINTESIHFAYPHPPVSFPTPCRSRGGGGGTRGPSLGQPKIFRCGSLCCCVGGCVVGHYHLHPLHSWQDILLTFAEMELDSTTMFPPGTSVMFIGSTGEPVLAQVVGHLAAYFPDGLKFSQLLDSAYFREHEDEQGSSSSSASNSDSDLDSDSGSVISSTDDDSSGGGLDAPDSARHANGGAESDVSSLTSAEDMPDAPTTDDDSDLNSDTEVVWVKSARGVWGMGHSFGNKLYLYKGYSRREMGSQKSACVCQASYQEGKTTTQECYPKYSNGKW